MRDRNTFQSGLKRETLLREPYPDIQLQIESCSTSDIIRHARGVKDGSDAKGSKSQKQREDGTVIDLPASNKALFKGGEKMPFFSCGGGYGDPKKKRDPERVAAGVNKGWLTLERAQTVYDVALFYDADTGIFKT